MIMTFLDSAERYLYASREIHTDAYCIYESLQTNPEVFMKECELDMTQDVCEDFFSLESDLHKKYVQNQANVSLESQVESLGEVFRSIKDKFNYDIIVRHIGV